MKRMIRLARTAMLLAWLYFSSPAHADQNATWVGFTSDWNNPFNWTGTPQMVPTGTATFDETGITKSLTIPGGATIEALQFNAPNYTFDVPDGLRINVNGVIASLANAPTFNVIGTPGHSTPAINFNNSSSAGTAQIILGQIIDTNNGFNAGFINFRENSTADQATITVRDQSATVFQDSSTADHATLIVDRNGFVGFVGTSDGAQATIINNFGGEVKIANLTTDGTSFGSIAGAGTYNLGSKQLTVGSNGDSTTVSGVIEDHFPGVNLDQVGGSLVKVGTGTLTLTNNNTYSGGTTIQDGTLVAGTPSAAQVISNALGTGNVSVVGGTLRTTSLLTVPSIVTGIPLVINVGRDYTQGPGGTLALGIGGLDGSQFDHVQVGGNATLDATLDVTSLNGFHPSDGDAFEVLHTNGKVSGNFSLLNDSNFNITPGTITGHLQLTPVEVVAPNGVLLVYVKSPQPGPPEPPPEPPVTPPGPPVEPGPPVSPPIVIDPKPLPPVEPDAPLPLPEVVTILDPTVEQLTSMFEIPFSGANTQRFNLTDRMTQIQQGSTGFVSPVAPAPAPIPTGKEIGKKEVVPPALVPGPTNRWGVWVNGWGDWVNVNDDNGAKGYDFTTGGVSVGVDYRITDNLAVGIFGTYAYTWTGFRPGDGDVNTGRGGLYATYWDPQGWWVNAGIWGGYNSYSTSRQALLGQANGSTSGYEFSTFGDAGYDFHCGDLTFGPIVSMQYTDVHVNGFSENGSLVPLDIHEDSEDSLRTDVGGRAYYNWHLGKMLIIPSLTIAWEHEYLYSNLPITASAPELGGATATFNGPNEGHDSLIINAGAGVQWTPNISTYIGYQGQLGRDNYNANGVTGTFSFSF
jgi:outer membrane autotransporter protein